MATTTTVFNPSWTRLAQDEAALSGGDGFAGNSYRVSSMAVGEPGLVVVGSWSVEDDPDAAFWYSADGAGWSKVPHDESSFGGTSSQGANAVVFTDAGFLAVGYDYSIVGEESSAAVWQSTDGQTWTRVPHTAAFGGPGSQIMTGLAQSGTMVTAVGWSAVDTDSHAAVWTTTDGDTWALVPHDETIFGGTGRQSMQAVTAFADGFVAVGYDEAGGDFDAAVWVSENGQTWARIAPDPAVFGGPGSQRMLAIVAGGPGLVAVGDSERGEGRDGAVWVSADGLTWTRVDAPTLDSGTFSSERTLRTVAVVGGVIVAGGSAYFADTDHEEATVYTSPDGLAWTPVEDESFVPVARYEGIATLAAVDNRLFMAGTAAELTGDSHPAFWMLSLD